MTTEHEHTLNVWTAELLRDMHGLDAKQERKQADRKRIDIEIRIGPVKIAFEAEQGQTTTKKREAISDADKRLKQKNADCAIAVCYPDGISEKQQIPDSRMLWTIRAPGSQIPYNDVKWTEANLGELASVIQFAPMQLGNPDLAAAGLSASLDRAVGRLSDTQMRMLAEALDLPGWVRSSGKIKASNAPNARYDRAAKRALLVVATAVMFHSRLDAYRAELKPKYDNRQPERTPFNGEWPPTMAQHCVKHADPIGAFYDAWELWLAVDYKPIFSTAQTALNGCPHDSAFTAAIREVSEAALALTRDIAGLRHDLLGRIFHTVLDTARYDGSFYTTTAAATLLASLAITNDMCDWNDIDAISKLRITDPACGTGTLLMAAAERIHELAPAARDDAELGQALIENVLAGYDVNLTATHMAATTLGLLSPTTRFQNMKIGRAFLGVDDAGKAHLGSLEFLDAQPMMMPWPGMAQSVSQVDDGSEMAQPDPSDIVIMNPPFTRDSLRHDQFSSADEAKLKAREKRLFANKPVHLSSNGNAFVILADFMRKRENGTIASILPLVTATNASSLDIRKFLGRDYHIDTLVVSHDPQRIYFSENTSIGEILLVCRLREDATKQKPPTRVVNLAVNPSTPAEAIAVARAIEGGMLQSSGAGTVQYASAQEIADGNWGAVQFLSEYLVKNFAALRRSEVFDSIPLSKVAEIGPDGRGLRGAFSRSKMPSADGMVALWDHNTDATQSMSAQFDTHAVAKRGKEKQARNLWKKRGRMLLPTRIFLPTVRVMSVRLESPALGSAWVPCKSTADDVSKQDQIERALCTYLNSSVGILAVLGDRSNRKPTYPNLSMDDLRKIVVPDFTTLDDDALETLVSAYDAHAHKTLLPLPQMNACDTRRALDAAVCAALGIDAEDIATIRRNLAAEPSVTGRRYGQ
ncbi:MAG: SAM-dependent DNA methyltransferase [Chloroflexi bacterium]|nr:SAM-dependent DNA methyltransferase [Chloroflexota bacterium]